MGWGRGVSEDFIRVLRSGMVTSVACMGDDEGEGPVLRNLRGTGREEGRELAEWAGPGQKMVRAV